MTRPRRQPTDAPQEAPRTLRVAPLQHAYQPPTGRPTKLKMPPLPQEIMDGMSTLERQHFDYFIRSFRQEYPSLSAADLLCLQQAAIEYINLLRVQARQLKSGEVISMARQHPGVQLRQWLDMLSVTRKSRPNRDEGKEVEKDLRDSLLKLSATG